MNKKMKALFTFTATLGVAATMSCATAFTCSADATPNAYLFLRSVSEEARYEGIDASVNTISDGAGTASVTANGSYQVSIDLSKEDSVDAIDEISILQLYVNVSEEQASASLKVDSLKIDGEEIAFTENPVCQKANSGTSLYLDLCDTNGESLFDRKEYQDVQTISVDFTVTGWPTAEETVEETTEETEDVDKTTKEVDEVPKTGETTAAVAVGVGVLIATAGMMLSKKNKF